MTVTTYTCAACNRLKENCICTTELRTASGITIQTGPNTFQTTEPTANAQQPQTDQLKS